MAGKSVDSKTMKRSYFWNTAGSIINAFQSVFILMVLTRVCDIVTAGIFTLAYANANLFHFVGFFGMRNYEASDIAPENGFRAYARSRVITSIAMVLCSWAYLAYSAVQADYSAEKILAVALMTLLKCVDVVEDVFDGNFQQHGRLDIAGRQLTFRLLTTMLLFCLVSGLTKNLVIAIAVSTVWSAAFLTISLLGIRRKYQLPQWHPEASNQRVLPLLRECLPNFLGAFLLYYIGNASKWAIDASLGDAIQAIYGFVFMPVFVINLVSHFIYVPLLQPLSVMWGDKEIGKFRKVFIRQIGIIVLITVVCIAGAALIGTPVLSLIFNVDLNPYRLELCLLLFGGGFYAFVNLFHMGLVVIRRQSLLVPCYVSVAVITWFASMPIVNTWQTQGAVALYVLAMMVLSLWLGIALWLNSKPDDSRHAAKV